MNKKLTAMILVGALACAMTVPAMAEGNTAVPISAPISVEEPQPLPDSVLYYGTVKEWVQDENGAIKQLDSIRDISSVECEKTQARSFFEDENQ